MTPAEAIAGLAPIVGGGGIAGIVIAYLGYRAEVMKGRRTDTREVAASIGHGLAAAKELEPLINALATLTGTLIRTNLLGEVALGAERSAEFRAWLEERELRELYDELKDTRDGRSPTA